MKKIALIVSLFLIIPGLLHSQDREMKRLFEKYAQVEGFKLEKGNFDLDIDLDGGFSNFLNNIDGLYILKFDNKTGNPSDLKIFKTKLNKQINKKGYKTMLDISSDGSVKILIRKNSRDKTTDYLMITNGDETTMFLWAGAG